MQWTPKTGQAGKLCRRVDSGPERREHPYSTKRKRYTAVFKSKVAVEPIRGVKTTAELASEHQVHPTLISEWKRQAPENLASPFEGGR
jgi:transposase-like protein